METQKIVYGLCRDYIHDLAETHPHKAVLLGFVRGRNLEALCRCSDLFDVQSNDVEVYRSLLQVEAFFRKNECFSDRERCLKAAQESFVKSELLCKLTNKRLNYFYSKPDRLDPDLRLVIDRARSWIQSTIGDVDNLTGKIPSLVRVTAGATASTSRRKSLPYLKVKKSPLSSYRCIPYIDALYSFVGIKGYRARFTPFNRVEFVPKNWKTYRTIACEPEGNVPFQLAFDSYVKGRLRKRGIDLSNQSRNQELARIGSIDGSFATIDISAASDTVSLNCCAWLFPTEWFQFMSDFRSSHFRNPLTGEVTSYEKFSSMGNGMTFGIETLVFASLLRACGSSEGLVYGDDICVETDKADLLLRALKFFGFKVNLDKTWISGNYRESCGTHWFKGKLITPFYFRGNFELKPFKAHVVNGLASISLPYGKLWNSLKSLITTEKLLLVPFNGASTSGVFIDFKSSVKLRNTRQKNWIFFCRMYEFRTSVKVDPGIRSLLLWYHDSFRVMPTVVSEFARVRSRYSVPLGRYRQRRVVVHKHDESVADHLPTWSEYVTH